MKLITLTSPIITGEILKVDDNYILTLNDNEISRDIDKDNIIKQFNIIINVLNILGIHTELEYYI